MAITASLQPVTLLKATQVWPDSMVEADFMPEYGVMTAIKKEQTAKVELVANLPDERDGKITWLNQCDLEIEDCVDNVCTFSGPSASSFEQAFTIDQCKQTPFSEPIDRWRGNMFGLADAEAINLNTVMRDQLEYVSKYAVAVINANAGINTNLPLGSGWDGVNTTQMTIPSNLIGTALYGYLRRNAKRNDLKNPYLLTGEALAQMNFLAETNAGNLDGRGDALRAGLMRIYEDHENIDEVNAPDLLFYMINRGALAFASKGYFPRISSASDIGNAEVLNGNYTRFSLANRWFPDLIHDVEREVSCASGVWSVHHRVKFRYKLFVNPTGCTAGKTGLLSFKVGDPQAV